MLQVARWLQGPIQEIEQLARDHHSQLVPHLADWGRTAEADHPPTVDRGAAGCIGWSCAA